MKESRHSHTQSSSWSGKAMKGPSNYQRSSKASKVRHHLNTGGILPSHVPLPIHDGHNDPWNLQMMQKRLRENASDSLMSHCSQYLTVTTRYFGSLDLELTKTSTHYKFYGAVIEQTLKTELQVYQHTYYTFQQKLRYKQTHLKPSNFLEQPLRRMLNLNCMYLLMIALKYMVPQLI